MAMSEKELKELADPKYWDERYIQERKKNREDSEPIIESFEWFRDFQKLRPFFQKHLPPPQSECHILHLGCGNSTLTADLHALGYTNQTSVDFSHVIIDAMKAKYSDLDTRWEFMDVRDLQLADASVDVAIDKGTLDAMIHGSLWDPPEDVRENVGRYVREVGRVLKPGCVWLYITYRQPHFMKIHLEQKDLWNLDVKVLEDPDGAGGFEYFSFIMQKIDD